MKKFLFILTIIFTATFFTGCLISPSMPTRHYSIPIQSVQNNTVLTSTFPKTGIGPVEIPDYLDKSAIITRIGKSQLDLAEFDQWAEPLRNSIPKIIYEDLSRKINTNNITTYPWDRSSKVKYQVKITIYQFEKTDEGNVKLQARWDIIEWQKNSKEIIVSKTSNYVEPVSDTSYSKCVEVHGILLNKLTSDITEELIKLK